MRTTFIEPGALRHELSLQAPTPVGDGMGGFGEGWQEVATLFGMVEPLSQSARFGAGQTLEENTHRITIRHRDGVASGMRLMKQGRVFDVVSVHDPDETGRYLVCRVKEVGA
jgi:SPP1 family predicted phage head-tail adaptor